MLCPSSSAKVRRTASVDSQGSSYARRSAFIPEARTIVRNHIRQLADYVVSEGTEHPRDGRWANTYDELYYHFGANITDANGNDKLLPRGTAAQR